MEYIDCSGWYICQFCRSDSYIHEYFPETHWAYQGFKTKSKRIFEQHESSVEHMKIFEPYYCHDCEEQFYSQNKFDDHCETIKHKRNCNITMNCEVCNYSTTEKTKLERHFQTLKHKNAVNGVQKEKIKFFCESCNYSCIDRHNFERHQQSLKHRNAINGVQKKEYICEKCNFKTKYESQMKIHEESKRHQKQVANLNTSEEVKVL